MMFETSDNKVLRCGGIMTRLLLGKKGPIKTQRSLGKKRNLEFTIIKETIHFWKCFLVWDFYDLYVDYCETKGLDVYI